MWIKDALDGKLVWRRLKIHHAALALPVYACSTPQDLFIKLKFALAKIWSGGPVRSQSPPQFTHCPPRLTPRYQIDTTHISIAVTYELCLLTLLPCLSHTLRRPLHPPTLAHIWQPFEEESEGRVEGGGAWRTLGCLRSDLH